MELLKDHSLVQYQDANHMSGYFPEVNQQNNNIKTSNLFSSQN
jgi:hypothetical protein